MSEKPASEDLDFKSKALEEITLDARRLQTEIEMIRDRLHRAETISRSGNWEFDLDSNRVLTSDGSRTIYGLDDDECSILQVQNITLPEDRPILDKAMRALISENKPYDVEYRIRRPDTGEVVHIHSVAEYDRGRNIVFGIIQNISDRKKIEDALRTSENKYRKLYEGMRDGFALVNMEGKILDCNEIYQQMLGYSLKELLQLNYEDLTPEKWHATERQIVRNQVLPRGYSDIYEKEYRHKDGTVFPVELRIFLLHNDDDGDEGMWAIVRDITERKRTEKALQRSERRYRKLHESTVDGIVMVDLKGHILDCNTAYQDMLGYTLEELTRVSYMDLTPERWHAYEQQIVETQIWTKGFSDIYEKEYRRKDRTIFPVELRSFLIQSDDGEEEYMGAIARDITQRKGTEEALRQSEIRYRSLFENMFEGFAYCRMIFDGRGQPQDFVYLAVNDAFESQSGLKDVVGKRVSDVIPGIRESDPELIKRYGRVALTGQPERFEVFVAAMGRWFDISVYSPQEEHFIAVFSCINERKQVEETLKENAAYIRTVMDNLPLGIAVSSAKTGIFEYMNDNFCTIYRTAREDIPDTVAFWQKVYEDPAFRDAFRTKVREDCTSGDPKRMLWEEIPIVRRGAETTFVSAANVPVSGKPLTISIAWDVTDRKLAEQERAKLQSQLNQAQKMESVGRLAGGVAHDFNNMLGAILGNAELAMIKVDPRQSLYQNLLEIRKAAERSANLTRQLLAFARKQDIAPHVLNLNETVEGMLNMLRRLIGENINLVWLPGEALWPVMVDPGQIDQILANLCVNAADAITKVGSVTIRTGNMTLDTASTSTHPEASPGDYVSIVVSDDGSGMDKKTLEKLFEPFFTTKETGKGTGLGLATVYGIVQQNNGFTHVDSEIGRGTTFNICLPRYTGSVQPQQHEETIAIIVRGNETILLVEDEPAILDMTTRMLQRAGYTVLAAASPSEALRLAKKHAGHVQLLITDVVMPEMNGQELAVKLLSRHSNLKLLFMSGYTADVITHHGVLSDDMNFIQKPFAMKDLALKVREVLNA